MKKNRITINFFIGLFVVVGFISIGFGLVWFGASKFFKENFYYVTYFEGSVEGVTKGTPVKYLGVPVGSVYDIRVAPDGKMIEIVMIFEKTVRITDSLRVKIELSGLTGGRFLQLFYSNDPYELNWYPRITFQPPYTYIKSAPSGIETLEASVREVVNRLMEFRFKDVSTSAVNFLDKAAEFVSNEELLQTIQNLQETTLHLKNLAGRLDTTRIIYELELASENINKITKKLENFADSLQKEIENAKFSERVDKTFTNVDSLVNYGNTLIYSFGTKAEMITYSLNDLLSGLKRSNSLLQKLIREYTQNPGQLLFSEPPPKED
ncbi:MAG: MlaD family protein [Candidatus Kapaibacteriota bacterium]|jgi:ABC-type transporter Mla subunit MlaD